MKKKYMKKVGRKSSKFGLKEANEFLSMILTIRNMNKDNKYIPKGIYKYKTFKEANLCEMKLILGNTPDRR